MALAQLKLELEFQVIIYYTNFDCSIPKLYETTQLTCWVVTVMLGAVLFRIEQSVHNNPLLPSEARILIKELNTELTENPKQGMT